jgi:tetratricopeptide (TPR) repeat protein
MRYSLIFVLIFSSLTSLQGQTLSEKIALLACERLDSIDNFKTLQDSIQSSITAAMATVMMKGTLEERKQIGTVEGIRGTLKEAFEILPSHCYNVRRLIIESKRKIFYKESENLKANVHFDKGNEYMEKEDYKSARKEFESAIKLDEKFVYAFDHLAISYRRQNNYKSAITYYNKSLDIFPEGDVALLNIAVCYSFLSDKENTMKFYNQMKYLYPDNPEGYYGAAKFLFTNADYENALENLFISHRIYSESKSELVNDSQKLIELFYSKLKELNQLDLFDSKAKEYGITIEK